MDNPDNPCEAELSDELLLDYAAHVRDKTLAYLDSLDDTMLNECPKNCPYTRLELILMQFRHLSVHIGMINGLTIEKTGRFPPCLWVRTALISWKKGYLTNKGELR